MTGRWKVGMLIVSMLIISGCGSSSTPSGSSSPKATTAPSASGVAVAPTVTSSLDPSTVNDSVTFTATISSQAKCGPNGSVSFYTNPNVQGANVLTNGGQSNYHALQLEVIRRTRHGLQGQFSYTFGKSLSNTSGDIPPPLSLISSET